MMKQLDTTTIAQQTSQVNKYQLI